MHPSNEVEKYDAGADVFWHDIDKSDMAHRLAQVEAKLDSILEILSGFERAAQQAKDALSNPDTIMQMMTGMMGDMKF